MGSLSSLKGGSKEPFAFGRKHSPLGRGVSAGVKLVKQFEYRDWQVSIHVVQRGVVVKRIIYRASLTGPLVTIKHVIEQQHSEAGAIRTAKQYIDCWHEELADFWAASDTNQLDRYRFLQQQLARQTERKRKERRDREFEDPEKVEWLE